MTVVADESVLERTGRSWTEWFELLDAAGSRGMSHQEIVALVARRYALDPWWQQAVTVANDNPTRKATVEQQTVGRTRRIRKAAMRKAESAPAAPQRISPANRIVEAM